MQETSIVSYSYLFKIMWAEVKKKKNVIQEIQIHELFIYLLI